MKGRNFFVHYVLFFATAYALVYGLIRRRDGTLTTRKAG